MSTKFLGYAIGDSFTHAVDTPVPKPEYYPSRVEAALLERGCSIKLANHGISGNTTGQVLSRVRMFPARRAPSLAIIYAGTNDWNRRALIEETPAPTNTSFKIDPGKAITYPAGISILVGKQKAVVKTAVDGLITVSEPLAEIPQPGDPVIQDTVQNLVEAGVTLRSRGFEYVIIGKQHFLNYAAGGDTVLRHSGLTGDIRAAQTAAAYRLGAPIADFYNFMRDRIITGKDQAGSASWHFKEGDSHLNDYGQGILAECVLASLPSGWIDAWA